MKLNQQNTEITEWHNIYVTKNANMSKTFYLLLYETKVATLDQDWNKLEPNARKQLDLELKMTVCSCKVSF